MLQESVGTLGKDEKGSSRGGRVDSASFRQLLKGGTEMSDLDE